MSRLHLPAAATAAALALVVALLPLLAAAPAGAATSTVSSVTSADAYVSSAAPRSKYGSAKVLRVSGRPTQRAYLGFVISNVTGPVTKAVLTLTPTKAAAVPLEVRQVTGTWSEGSVTWATAPALGALVGSAASVPTDKLSIDVTSAVTGNGSVNLALVVPAAAATSSVVAVFASRAVSSRGATLTVSFTPPDTTPPAPPTGLTATAGDSIVSLSWSPSTEPDLSGYRVYRRVTGSTSPAERVGNIGTAGTTYEDRAVTNGSTYEYHLTAVDAAGNESTRSAAVAATPQPPPDTTPPAVPAGVAVVSGDGSATLSWQANSEPDLAGYRIYRRGSDGTWPQGRLTALAATTWTDVGLPNGAEQAYRVTAVDLAGNESAPSTPVAATPQAAPPPDTTPPAAPTGLALTSSTPSPNLTWQANSEPDLAGYRIYRRGPDGTWPAAHLAQLTATTWTDTDLPNRSLLEYRVTAVDTAGNESTPATLATGLESLDWRPSAPAVPSNGVVYPESYGAKGDGVTDDWAALQQAVDDAAAKNMKVELGAKTYVLGKSLLLPSRSYMYGAGPGSILQFTWTVNDPTHDGLYVGNKDQVAAGNTDITLHNFAIRGAGSGLPEGLNATHDHPRVPGIRFRLVDRFQISQLEISNVPGISLLNQGSSDGLIHNNHVHHSGRDGINTGWHLRASHRVLVLANRIEKVGDDGIALLGANGSNTGVDPWSYELAAIGNTLDGWQTDPNGKMLGRGIAVMSVKDSDVLANVVDSTKSDGILVAPAVNSVTGVVYRSADVRLNGNVVRNAGQLGAGGTVGNGAAVKRSDRILFSATTIINPKSMPMVFYDCVDCSQG